jgi:hypothetical protein
MKNASAISWLNALNELPPARIPESIVWIEAQDADTGDLAEVLAFARGKYQIKDR